MTEGTYWNRHLGGRLTRRGLLRAGGMTGAGLAGAALLGCGEDEPTPAATPAPGAPAPTPTPPPDPEGARQGGTLGMPNGIPQDNFNPVINVGEAHGLSAWHVYDRPLTPLLEDPGYRLEAAESVELNDDVTVVMRLQPGLVYQDRPPVNGRPVESEDIAIHHEYISGEDRASDASFQREVIDHMELPDDRTIIFHLQRPTAALFSGDALGRPHNNCIVPRELSLGDFDTMEPVGSGPYQLRSHQFQVRYEYERNPTWRRSDEGMPYIDTRVRLPMTDSTALEAAFRGEQIHVWIPPAETADRIVRDLDEQLEVTEFVALNPFIWAMASSQEWFDDIRTREAFYRAFDPQEHIDLVANGWAVKPTGKLAQGLEPYLLAEGEMDEFLGHNEAEARQLLEASGWDFDHIYSLSTLSGANNEQSLQVFQEQWRRIGVQTNLDVRPASEWLPNVSRSGNFDFAAGVGFPAYDHPQSPIRIHHTTPHSINQWFNMRNPEVDAMIEASEVLTDREAHIEAVKEIQRDLFRRYSNLSYIMTFMQRELRYSYVRDWEFTPTFAVMFRPEAWLDL